MKTPTISSLLILLGAIIIIVLMPAGNAEAISIPNLTGMWTDDHGNFIEIERNGPDAVATMRSSKARDNWVRGTMDLSGSDILLVKRRNTRVIGQARGEFVNKFGRPQIRWDSGRIWKKSTRQDYNRFLRDSSDRGDAHLGGHPGPELASLNGRWQTSDKTIIQITQKGPSLNVQVLSRQGSRHSHHPWTSGSGRISNSQLSLDCYHGTTLAERVSGRYDPGSEKGARINWSNGQTWYRQAENFKVITAPVVAVCRLPVNVIGTAIPSRATSTWQYNDGGYFHRGDDDRWNEYSTAGELRYRYRETRRTNNSVTLIDDRRGISVHLQQDQCWIQQSGLADWRQVSPGRWSQGPPANTRQPDFRHSGHNHGRSGNSPIGNRVQSSHRGQPGGGGLGQLLQGLFRK